MVEALTGWGSRAAGGGNGITRLRLSFKFSPLLDDSSKQLFPSLEYAPKPIFDQTGSKTDTWHDRGLNQYGPYTAKVFTPNRPKLCVICQKAHKGRVEQFLHKFINGIAPPASSSRGGKPQKSYFEKGLLRKHALKTLRWGKGI